MDNLWHLNPSTPPQVLSGDKSASEHVPNASWHPASQYALVAPLYYPHRFSTRDKERGRRGN